MSNKDIENAMKENFDIIYSQHTVAVARELSSVMANWPGKEGNKKKINNKHPQNIQLKLFIEILEGIDWRQQNSKNIVMLSTIGLAAKLGWDVNKNFNLAYFTYYVKEQIVQLMQNSVFTIKKREHSDLGVRYFCDYMILKAEVNQKYVAVMLNPAFLPYLKGFYDASVPFVTLLGEDLQTFKSEYASWLYIGLKNTVQKKGSIFEAEFTTYQLKSELFGSEESDYTRVKKNGEIAFRRTDWERKTLDKAIEEINSKSQYMKILPQMNEKGQTVFYTKNYTKKKGKKAVDKYHFKFELDVEKMTKEMYFTNFPKDDEHAEFDTNKYFSKELSDFDFSSKSFGIEDMRENLFDLSEKCESVDDLPFE